MGDFMDTLETLWNDSLVKKMLLIMALTVAFVGGVALEKQSTTMQSNNTATHIDNNVPGITTVKNNTSTIDSYGDGTIVIHQGNSIFVMHSK